MSDTDALPPQRVPEPPLGGRLLGDENLAKLAGRGSERAFAALYERHHQAIYRYCRSILHNDHDAQEAMQSAMMRAYTALRAQERELAVKPWLFRIAHNESISMLRRRRPAQELSEEHQHPGSDVEHTLERRERLATLVADLQALPERQRAVLLMRELSGLSMQEIGEALQMTPGAAKQTLFEARSSLHELVQGRAMKCESVRQTISLRDGRLLRGRRIRAHLRACGECRAFRESMSVRRTDLAAIAPPLPAPVAAALLAGLLAHGNGHAGGLAGAGALTGGSGAAGAGSGPATGAGAGVAAAGPTAAGSGAASTATTGAGASALGGHAAASLAGKGIATVAVLAAAAAGGVHLAASPSHRHAGTPSRVTHPSTAHSQNGQPDGLTAPIGANGTPLTARSRRGAALRQQGTRGALSLTGANAHHPSGKHGRSGFSRGATEPGNGHPRDTGATRNTGSAPRSGRSRGEAGAEGRAPTRAAPRTHRPNGGSRGRRQSGTAHGAHRGQARHSQHSHAHSIGQSKRRERSSSSSAGSEGSSSSHKQAHEPSHAEAKGAAESSAGASQPRNERQQH